MKTILSIALSLAANQALASNECSIKVYAKGQLIKVSQPVLYKNEVSCSSTATAIINGTLTLEEGKADAVEFSYSTDGGQTIKGSLYK